MPLAIKRKRAAKLREAVKRLAKLKALAEASSLAEQTTPPECNSETLQTEQPHSALQEHNDTTERIFSENAEEMQTNDENGGTMEYLVEILPNKRQKPKTVKKPRLRKCNSFSLFKRFKCNELKMISSAAGQPNFQEPDFKFLQDMWRKVPKYQKKEWTQKAMLVNEIFKKEGRAVWANPLVKSYCSAAKIIKQSLLTEPKVEKQKKPKVEKQKKPKARTKFREEPQGTAQNADTVMVDISKLIPLDSCGTIPPEDASLQTSGYEDPALLSLKCDAEESTLQQLETYIGNADNRHSPLHSFESAAISGKPEIRLVSTSKLLKNPQTVPLESNNLLQEEQTKIPFGTAPRLKLLGDSLNVIADQLKEYENPGVSSGITWLLSSLHSIVEPLSILAHGMNLPRVQSNVAHVKLLFQQNT